MKPPLIFKTDADYTYASGVIRGLENYILKRNDFQKLWDADASQTSSVLAELGYGGGEHDAEHALDVGIEILLKTIDKLVKNPELADVLRYKYDFSNISAYLKAHFAGEVPRTFVQWGKFAPEKLFKLIEAQLLGEKTELPPLFVDGINRAKRYYNTYRTSAAVDAALDATLLLHNRRVLPIGDFFERYFAVLADWANVLSFIRTVRANFSVPMFWESYVHGGDIEMRVFTQAFTADAENAHNAFAFTEYGKTLQEAIRNALAGEGELLDTIFRRARKKLFDATRYCSFGPELIVGYAGAKLDEIAILRVILRAKAAKMQYESIREVISYVVE